MPILDRVTIIRKKAGKVPVPDLAQELGITENALRIAASREGISLAIPQPVEPKRQYWASAPKGEESAFSEDVKLVMERKDLRSQSSALVWCVQFTAKVLRAKCAMEVVFRSGIKVLQARLAVHCDGLDTDAATDDMVDLRAVRKIRDLIGLPE